MVVATPEAYIATMSKAKRTGKIFIDYLRNNNTATAIADYGVRARPGAPVAVPLAWDELKGLQSASGFTMKDVLKRVKHRKPPAPAAGQVLAS
jgi:bifunctional non-homologous end joining protein LigD